MIFQRKSNIVFHENIFDLFLYNVIKEKIRNEKLFRIDFLYVSALLIFIFFFFFDKLHFVSVCFNEVSALSVSAL